MASEQYTLGALNLPVKQIKKVAPTCENAVDGWIDCKFTALMLVGIGGILP